MPLTVTYLWSSSVRGTAVNADWLLPEKSIFQEKLCVSAVIVVVASDVPAGRDTA